MRHEELRHDLGSAQVRAEFDLDGGNSVEIAQGRRGKNKIKPKKK